MKTSNKGIDLIASHEGLRLKAYRCPAGVLTIGYGHTANVKETDVITESYARYLLSLDIQNSERAVERNLPNLNQNQFDALVSFVFNVGSGSFQSSTLLKKARLNPDDVFIAKEFAKWNKSRDKFGRLVELPGLTKRRKDESDLYFSE